MRPIKYIGSLRHQAIRHGLVGLLQTPEVYNAEDIVQTKSVRCKVLEF